MHICFFTIAGISTRECHCWQVNFFSISRILSLSCCSLYCNTSTSSEKLSDKILNLSKPGTKPYEKFIFRLYLRRLVYFPFEYPAPIDFYDWSIHYSKFRYANIVHNLEMQNKTISADLEVKWWLKIRRFTVSISPYTKRARITCGNRTATVISF